MSEGVFMDAFADINGELYYVKKAYLAGDLEYRDNVIHNVELMIFRMGGSVIVLKVIEGVRGVVSELEGRSAIMKVIVPERDLKEVLNSSPPKVAVRR